MDFVSAGKKIQLLIHSLIIIIIIVYCTLFTRIFESGEQVDSGTFVWKWPWFHSHAAIEKELLVALLHFWINKGRRSMIPHTVSMSDMETFIWTTIFKRRIILNFH